MSKQIDLRVANLDCEHDAAAIERGLKAPAARSATRSGRPSPRSDSVVAHTHANARARPNSSASWGSKCVA